MKHAPLKKKRNNPSITKWLLALKQRPLKSYYYSHESSWGLTMSFCFEGKTYIFVFKCWGLDGSRIDSYDVIFGAMRDISEWNSCYEILSSVKLSGTSSLQKVCSHWQRQPQSYYDYVHRGAKGLSLCLCVCGNNDDTKGGQFLPAVPIHIHKHISVRFVPALQPSTLRGTLELKTHWWLMHYFFLCVRSGINVQQKCSYGNEFVWNPLSPTSHRLRDTHNHS